jgi:hypothetical protein
MPVVLKTSIVAPEERDGYRFTVETKNLYLFGFCVATDRKVLTLEPAPISPQLRDLVYTLDGWECVYCAARDVDKLQVDHVFPKSRGGSTAANNLLTACASCNRKKNAWTPNEAIMTANYGRFVTPHKIRQDVTEALKLFYNHEYCDTDAIILKGLKTNIRPTALAIVSCQVIDCKFTNETEDLWRWLRHIKTVKERGKLLELTRCKCVKHKDQLHHGYRCADTGSVWFIGQSLDDRPTKRIPPDINHAHAAWKGGANCSLKLAKTLKISRKEAWDFIKQMHKQGLIKPE